MLKQTFPILSTIAWLTLFLAAACAPRTGTSQSVVAPTQASVTQELTVFAAASLTDSFKEIGQEFQTSHTGVRVTFNFAGSQQLSQQIQEGAKADVFAPANTTEMEKLFTAGLVPDGGRIFANNRLVVITPKDNPGRIDTLNDLAKVNLKLVIADKSVPVGSYTLAMLNKMSADAEYRNEFGAAVLKNVVSQENNVRAVVAKVALGEADAGVVYVTDATPDMMTKLKTLAVPDKFNQIAKYPIIVLEETPQPALAREFVGFVLGEPGQSILRKWNFLPFQ